MRKRHGIRGTVVLPLLVVFWAAGARAQQAAGAGEALVIAAENRTALAEAERGAPRGDDRLRAGDVIRYTLTFTNPTEGPVRNVVLRNPVPVGLQLVGGSTRISAVSARLEYSIDGGATFSPQPMIEVVEDGSTVRRPAPPELYTDIRWTVESPVQPGAQVSASYEMRMPAEAPAATEQARGAASRTVSSGTTQR